MNHQSSQSYRHLRLGCVLLLILAGFSTEANAGGKRVVVMEIVGSQGAFATRQITQSLRTQSLRGQYELVSAARLSQAARTQKVSLRSGEGKSIAARALSVSAIVTGSLSMIAGRWVLKLTVLSGHNGRPSGSAVIPLRGPRLDPATANRVPITLASALAGARTGPPVSAPAKSAGAQNKKKTAEVVEIIPEPPEKSNPVSEEPKETPEAPAEYKEKDKEPEKKEPGRPEEAENYASVPELRSSPPSAPPTNETLGFEVENGPEGKTKVPSYRPDSTDLAEAPAVEEDEDRSPVPRIFELSFGLLLLNRSFEFNDPVSPAKPPNYSAGSIPALHVQGTIYPLAYGHRGPLSDLGLTGSYFRAIGLRSQLEQGADPLTTSLDCFEFGLRYRWNIMGTPMSPVFKAGVEYGKQDFSISPPPQDLPNLSYNYLKLALAGFDVPAVRYGRALAGLYLNFDYLLIFGAGDIERTDSSGYGSSSVAGIDGAAGAYGEFGDFFFRGGFTYRRIFFDFDNVCASEGVGCNTAGGALDILLGGSLIFGFSY